MNKHSVQNMMQLMATRINSIADHISDEEVSHFIQELLNARRIYVMGAGRSGLVAKAFAMRLMHLGMISYVVGETITPALQRGDLIVVLSGSGKTRTIMEIVQTAKEIGGRISLITSNSESPIGKIADTLVIIESVRDSIPDESMEYDTRQMLGEHRSFAPLGTLFETAAMTFCDAVISRLMEITKTDESALKDRHANIE
ncbi:MAG TPA: 6-phospho-3-hexuloisomerase [Methanospirillum sp.]|jgi:6-phospho-3-hexuloisomerase|uniref:6-phospho-3-hexuloisomerase n=1 Tax=Methanospirillum sp. TaxID=45200 RepID=UPI0009D398C5|nr:6-phospho-3-hexuloisomerase [Methanospirillum sp.]NLL09336.1 6-phospho-3-hexuloisomerase [Methanomicrobiales archaeon]OQB37364.1 MAG: 3-hexulose-6-phosphate isomerase [Euryarchaeota archaeon ADurb.Bin165]HPY59483.1 6-phospho-3-hexuloisomerase [Methanospirillum sp.]